MMTDYGRGFMDGANSIKDQLDARDERQRGFNNGPYPDDWWDSAIRGYAIPIAVLLLFGIMAYARTLGV